MTDSLADPRLEGFKELGEALEKLETAYQGKVLRGVSMSATLPVVNKAKREIPEGGSRVHKTYRGKEVQPGYAKRRGIKRRAFTTAEGTKAHVFISVVKDAFYVLNWLNTPLKPGVAYIRKSTRGNKHMVYRQEGSPEKHKDWFEKAFESQQDKVIERMSKQMIKRLEKIAAEGYAKSQRRTRR